MQQRRRGLAGDGAPPCNFCTTRTAGKRPQGPQPLVLLLLDLLFHVAHAMLQTIYWAAWGPMVFYMRSTQSLVCHCCFESTLRRRTYSLLLLPRLLASWGCIAVFLLISIGPVYVCGSAAPRFLAPVVALIWALCLREGWRIWENRGMHKQLCQYVAGIWDAQVDMAALVGGAVCVLGLVRIPNLLRSLHSPPPDGLRMCVARELLKTCGDWFVMPWCLILLALPWRLPGVWHAQFVLPYWRARALLIESSISTVIDLPFFSCALLPAACLYRIPSLMQAWRAEHPEQQETWQRRRFICVEAFVQTLIDLVFCMCALMSLYRFPLSLRARSVHEFRKTAVSSLICTVLDLLTLALSTLLIIPTVYRIHRLEDILLRTWPGPYAVYVKLLKESLLVIRDGFGLLCCTAVILIGFWRAPVLLVKLYRTPLDDKANVCASTLLHVACDWPSLVTSLLTLLTPWRTWQLIKICWVAEPEAQRAACDQQCKLGLNDLPYVFCSAVVIMTGWRAPYLLLELRQSWNEGRSEAQLKHLIFHQFVELFLDVPCIICGILCCLFPWNFLCMRSQLRNASSAEECRCKVYEFFYLGLKDIMAGACVAFVTLTGWRAIRMWHDILRMQPSSQSDNMQDSPSHMWHQAAVFHASSLVSHPSEILCTLLLPLALWRAPGLCFDMLKASTCHPDSHWRNMAYSRVLLVGLDLIAAVAFMPLLLSMWRLPELQKDLQRRKSVIQQGALGLGAYASSSDDSDEEDLEAESGWLRDHIRVHLAIFQQVSMLCLDICLAEVVGIACIFAWRLPKLFRELNVGSSYRHRLRVSLSNISEGLLDIPLAMLLLTAHLFIWRSHLLRRDLCKDNGYWHWYSVSLWTIGQGLLDLPCACFAALLCITWRGQAGRRHLASLATETVERGLILSEFANVVLDLAFVLMAPAALWRLPNILNAAFPPSFLEGGAYLLKALKITLHIPSAKTRTGSGTLDGHGIVLHLQGHKPPDLTFSHATLTMDDKFLCSLHTSGVAPRSAVAAFTMAMHPLQICNSMLESSEFSAGSADVFATLQIGTGERGGPKVSHSKLFQVVQKLVDAGDVPCIMSLECQCGTGLQRRARGRLTKLALPPSAILAARRCGSQELTTEAGGECDLAPSSLTAWGLRLLVLSELASTLGDIACAILILTVCLFPWRLRSLWKQLLAESTHLNWAKASLENMCKGILDILLIASLMSASLFGWRVPAMCTWLREDEAYVHWFMVCLKIAMYGALDVPFTVLAATLLFTWRCPAACNFFRSLGTRTALHLELLCQVMQFILDLPFVASSPLLLWRLPKVMRAIFPVPMINGGECLLKDLTVTLELPERKTKTKHGKFDGHGLIFHIQGSKPTDFTFNRGTLTLSNQFLQSLSSSGAAPKSAVAAFKMAMHPMQLCNSMLDSHDFSQGACSVSTRLHIGTAERGGPPLRHEKLMALTKKLVQGGDVPCGISLECTCGTGVWRQARGQLVRFSFPPSVILAASHDGVQPLPVSESSPKDSVQSLTCAEMRCLVVCQLGSVVADIVSLLLLICTCVVPWRISGAISTALSEDLWKGACKHAVRSAKHLPLELSASLTAAPLPWHWSKVTGALFQVDFRRRSSILLSTIQESLQDYLAIFLLIAAGAAPWRFPLLASDVYLALLGHKPWLPANLEWLHSSCHHDAWRQRRRTVLLVGVKQCVFVVLDLLAMLELCFIILTLVSMPAFVGRFWNYLDFLTQKDGSLIRWSFKVLVNKARQHSKRMVHWHRVASQQRVLPVNPIFRRSELCRHIFLPMLEAEELSHLRAVSEQWSEEAAGEQLWSHLYRRRWPHSEQQMFDGTGFVNARLRYIARHKLERQSLRKPSQAELDYDRGWRQLLHEQFSYALFCCPHTALLPLKVLGYMCSPLHWLVGVRHVLLEQNLRTVHASSAWEHLKQGVKAALLSQLASSLHCKADACKDFWKRERFLFYSMAAASVMVVNELAAALALLSGLSAVVLTGCGPLWMHYLGHESAGGHVADAVLGIATPFFLMLQVSVALGPFRISLWTWLEKLWQENSPTLLYVADILGQHLAGLTSKTSCPATLQAMYSSLMDFSSKGGLATAAQTQLGSWSRIMFAHAKWSLSSLFIPFSKLLELEVMCAKKLLLMSTPLLQKVAPSVLVATWHAGALLWIVLVALWYAKVKHLLARLFPKREPLWLYRSMWKMLITILFQLQILTKRVLHSLEDMFDASLAYPTRLCRRTGIVGDIALVPVALIWMTMPMSAAWYCAATRPLYGPALICSLWLVKRGRRIITEIWSS